MQLDYLLVGGGIAAARAIEGIRALDPTGSVALVTEEAEPPYHRPLISYVLAGRLAEKALPWRPQDFYRCHEIQLYLGRRVVSLDAATRVVTLDGGGQIAAGKLLLATGSRPATPPIPGRELAGVFTCANWADVREIKDYLEQHRMSKAVVIGGGLIGLKAAEALHKLGMFISLVELQPHLLPTILDHEAGALLAGMLREKGWKIFLQRRVTAISGRDRVAGVNLDDGTILDAGLVIVAVGVQPNTGLAKAAGLDVNEGILVDGCLQSNRPGIFAAGDVAEGWDALAGRRRVLALWPVASRQGYLAGINMAGGRRNYEGGMATNATTILGYSFTVTGLSKEDAAGSLTAVREGEPAMGTYRKLVFKDDRLVGAILMGEVSRAGILTGLIQAGLPVRHLASRLLRPNPALIDLPAAYRHHLLTTARSGRPGATGGENYAAQR